MAGREVTLGRFVEAEAGAEVHFCPIKQLPICRGGRVRALPSFHLLSLAAGREALANGFYTAFGKKFPCKDLEYLHPDDKIFICAKDNKAFLHQMSMQYHRYINHELGERKAERRRMRDRAVERRQAHKARQQGKLPTPVSTVGPTPASTVLPTPASTTAPVARDGSAAVATDPYLAEQAASAASAAAPSAGVVPTVATTASAGRTAASVDPYGPGAGGAMDPYLAKEAPVTDSTAAAPGASAAALATQGSPAAAPATTASPVKRQQPPPASSDDGAEDLYGDMGGGEAKKAKSTSAYASAVDSMLDDDFGDDE